MLAMPSATPTPVPAPSPIPPLYAKLRIFVASESTDQVWVLDGKPGEQFALIGKITVGKLPHQLAVSPDGKWVAVNNRMGNTTSIIDPLSMKEVVRLMVAVPGAVIDHGRREERIAGHDLINGFGDSRGPGPGGGRRCIVPSVALAKGDGQAARQVLKGYTLGLDTAGGYMSADGTSDLKLSKLDTESTALTRDNDRLKLELATLRSPARLESIARTQLGMAPPQAASIIHLGKKR